MKIYQTSVFALIISLLYIVKMATERHLHLGQIKYQYDELVRFAKILLKNINNFSHIYISGLEIRSMHPPNKPHPI